MIIFAPSEEKIKQAVEYVAPLVEPFKNIKPKRRVKKKVVKSDRVKIEIFKEDIYQGNLLRCIVNCTSSARSEVQEQKQSLLNSFSTAYLSLMN